ncbi:ArsA-related P-loop ATPase [Streptomyces sodiiphilus]|uniref:ArsA-related P-loop ATPase n=1 Tax=Streptomyces sodiiphilus TaxID=226217 RepID=A0ABN2PVZ6_9ACTN
MTHPGPRTVLVTGPGGAGRTTVAAATALAAARGGERALLLSGEPEARLAALLGTAPPAWPAAPAAAAHGLRAVRVDSAARFRAGALALQRHGSAALDALGAVPLDDDELTELPGAGELALLHAMGAAHGSREWDLLVVDLPPAADAVRMLALPGQLRRYLRRLLPPERRTARALRPLLAQLAGVPMPAQGLYEAAGRLDASLAAVQAVTEHPGTAVRLVAEPEAGAVAALRTVRAGLALHGLRAGPVVANRVLPAGSGDPWLASAAARQRTALEDLARLAAPECGRSDEAPKDVRELPHLGREVSGPGDLGLLAELAGPAHPQGPPGPAVRPGELPVDDRLARDGTLVWRLPLPGAVREELDLVRRGDELVVTVGPFRRVLELPPVLRRCTVTGAGLRGGALAVRFAPDPGLWPAGTAGT